MLEIWKYFFRNGISKLISNVKRALWNLSWNFEYFEHLNVWVFEYFSILSLLVVASLRNIATVTAAAVDSIFIRFVAVGRRPISYLSQWAVIMDIWIFEYMNICVYFTSFALVACWLVRVFWNFLIYHHGNFFCKKICEIFPSNYLLIAN